MSGTDDPFLDDDAPLAPSDAVAAILTAPGGRYVLQLRDDKHGIFYPGHWGCFGGALEASDGSLEEGLRRELREETGIELKRGEATYFTDMTFDLSFAGLGIVRRAYYEVHLDEARLARLKLGEGSRFAAFAARDALSLPRLVPYDGFALWLYGSRGRLVERAGV